MVKVTIEVPDRVSAGELRKMLGVEPGDSVEVPVNVREKDRERIRWLHSTQT